MKTNYLKNSTLLIIILAAALTARAKKSAKVISDSDRRNSHHYVSNANGKRKESIQTYWHNKTYRMELVDHKMTEFYVDDEKILENKWGEYKTVIAEIREQIR